MAGIMETGRVTDTTDGKVVGAVGASGGDGAQDEEVARAAATSLSK
jgi:uncharacterized protein GlcG (DUF336 family)